jgi:hypothetical protein
MKKALVVAGLGAAITASTLLGAGAASADSDSFLYAAHNAGFYNNSGVYAELAQGRQICGLLYQGYSEYDVQGWIYRNTGSGVQWADAGQLLALAEDHLC